MSEGIRDVTPSDRMRPVQRAATVLLVSLLGLFTAISAFGEVTPGTIEAIREQVALDVQRGRPPQGGIDLLTAEYPLASDQSTISSIYSAYRELFETVSARGALDFELGREPRSADLLGPLHGDLISAFYDSLRDLSFSGLDIPDRELLEIYESGYLEAKRKASQRNRMLWLSYISGFIAALGAIGWLVWRRWRRSMAGKEPRPSEAKPSEPPAYRPKVLKIGKEARIESIHLRGIRGFEDFPLSFLDSSDSPRMATLVIGRNGTNKSTLLRCIALGLADQVDATALLSKPIGALVSEKAELGEIEIVLRGKDGETHEIKKRIRSSGGKEYIESEPPEAPSYDLFVVAYGAGRAGVGTDPGRKYRILDSVLTLFDYSAALIDTELTLHRLEKTLSGSQFEATKNGLKRVLNLSAKDDLRPARGGGVEVLESSLDKPVRLESWADGYRLTLSWLLDLYGWAMRAERIGGKGIAYGIALIDELDQHLHPSMQARVFRDVKRILPEMQLIATTHSPLMALGATPDELVALRRANGRVDRVDSPDFSFFSAVDMLKDKSLFDTGVYAPEVNEMLEEYYRLAATNPEKLSKAERAELRRIADQLASRQMIPSQRDEEEDREIQDLLRSLPSASK